MRMDISGSGTIFRACVCLFDNKNVCLGIIFSESREEWRVGGEIVSQLRRGKISTKKQEGGKSHCGGLAEGWHMCKENCK